MYFVDNNTGVPSMPPMSPAQGNAVLWFTEGDHNKGISVIGQDFLNGLLAEHLNILAEAGFQPDKTKLNQLVLSIKAIITKNALIQTNHLKEIADAGAEAQKDARDHLGLGRLATKDSLGPADVNALAKDQNLADVPDKAEGRKNLGLGNSATRDVGTAANTVAAGDDSRITGAMQKAQNGADIPDKPKFVEILGLTETVNKAAGAVQKDQNGADIPDKDLFVRNVGAARAFSGAASIGGGGNWTTAEFITWLEAQGAFKHPYWMCKGYWSYADNRVITDTGCGNIHLAGAVVEVMGIREAITIRITTPTTSMGGVTNAQFTYINHGDDYSPGWHRDYNTANPPPATDLTRYATTAWVQQWFVQNMQRGALGSTPTINGASRDVPAGCVMVGTTMDVWGSRGTHVTQMRYCPLQVYINGAWRTIAG